LPSQIRAAAFTLRLVEPDEDFPEAPPGVVGSVLREHLRIGVTPHASPDTVMSSVSRSGAITIPLAFSLNRWPNRGRERPEMNVIQKASFACFDMQSAVAVFVKGLSLRPTATKTR
jgi:hypothetical protein